MVKTIEAASDFKKAVSAKPVVVVDFFATWCPPCQAVAPLFEAWSNESETNGDAEKIDFLKIDVDQLQAVAAMNNVTAMPTFHVYVNGELQRAIVGANVHALRGAIDEAKRLVVA